jgi:dTDP-4-dehydrorhamnose reductase
MKVLVTGASGFLGRYVAERLALAHEVIGTYLNNDASVPGCDMRRVDLADPGALAALISEEEPDAVVHTAAAARPDMCENAPESARTINVESSIAGARAARETGARFYFTSSDLVFDGANSPYRENEKPNPLSVYAKMKLEAEKGIKEACPSSLILRLSLLFGWTKGEGETFTEELHRKLHTGESVRLFSDQKRAALYVRDASEMIVQLVEMAHDPGSYEGIFHLAGPAAVSRLRFGETLCDVFDFDRNLIEAVKMADVPSKAPRPLDCSLDGERLCLALRYRPRTVLMALRDMLVRVP